MTRAPGLAGSFCSPRARSRMGRLGGAVSMRETRTAQAMQWWVPPLPALRRKMPAGMSRQGRGRDDNDQTLALVRWPPQLAVSQISAATRIATKNTTTMKATGIVRSLWSCLCTSVSLAVDGAGHGAAYKPGAAALAASAAPGSACSCRTYACSIWLAPRSLLRRGPRAVRHRRGWPARPSHRHGPSHGRLMQVVADRLCRQSHPRRTAGRGEEPQACEGAAVPEALNAEVGARIPGEDRGDHR